MTRRSRELRSRSDASSTRLASSQPGRPGPRPAAPFSPPATGLAPLTGGQLLTLQRTVGNETLARLAGRPAPVVQGPPAVQSTLQRQADPGPCPAVAPTPEPAGPPWLRERLRQVHDQLARDTSLEFADGFFAGVAETVRPEEVFFTALLSAQLTAGLRFALASNGPTVALAVLMFFGMAAVTLYVRYRGHRADYPVADQDLTWWERALLAFFRPTVVESIARSARALSERDRGRLFGAALGLVSVAALSALLASGLWSRFAG